MPTLHWQIRGGESGESDVGGAAASTVCANEGEGDLLVLLSNPSTATIEVWVVSDGAQSRKPEAIMQGQHRSLSIQPQESIRAAAALW